MRIVYTVQKYINNWKYIRKYDVESKGNRRHCDHQKLLSCFVYFLIWRKVNVLTHNDFMAGYYNLYAYLITASYKLWGFFHEFPIFFIRYIHRTMFQSHHQERQCIFSTLIKLIEKKSSLLTGLNKTCPISLKKEMLGNSILDLKTGHLGIRWTRDICSRSLWERSTCPQTFDSLPRHCLKHSNAQCVSALNV